MVVGSVPRRAAPGTPRDHQRRIAVFVSLVGQDDNLGDSLLRREYLDALRDFGLQFHILIGANSDAYVSGLGLGPDDVVYRSRRAWLDSYALRRHVPTSFVANPGEIDLRRHGWRHLGGRQILAIARVRRQGGIALQTGVGIRRVDSLPRRARPLALALFDVVAWRDDASRSFSDRGSVAPDWGFLSGPAPEAWLTKRDTISISLRGDVVEPSDEWFGFVERLAQLSGYELVVVVQVARDAARARLIARRLGATLVDWSADVPHDVQEEVVRSVYRRSGYVVSDRLHALVAGATEGAIPLGMGGGPIEKLQRTLAVVGLDAACIDTGSVEPALADRVHASEVSARGALTESIVGARVRLTELGVDLVSRILSTSSETRLT